MVLELTQQLFYLTRKGSGQASNSNSIPHASFESSGMQIAQ